MSGRRPTEGPGGSQPLGREPGPADDANMGSWGVEDFFVLWIFDDIFLCYIKS